MQSTPVPGAMQELARAIRGWRLHLDTDALALLAGLALALTCNGAFLSSALAGRSFGEPGTWAFALALLVMLAALHTLLLGLVLHRRLAKPVLTVVIVVAALATFYMGRFGVFLDPAMLRNTLRTNWGEARELIGGALVWHLALYAALPLMLLWRLELPRRPVPRALLRRGLLLLGAVMALAGTLLLVFQDFSSLMRKQRELRYLITPANVAYSMGRVVSLETAVAAAPRAVVGADARLSAEARARTRPMLLVIAVGETARAASWGLSGYTRQTTPQLAATPGIVNFTQVTACGTNTETSLPCMFSAVGRRDYDERRIRGSESLLHVLARAGVQVLWRDNQSGCKGVCEGLAEERIDAKAATGATAALCDGHHCLDEVLLHGLEATLQGAKGDLVLVLHMLGNHGPAYHRRYPKAFARFSPACESDDLRQCSREQIVNAYDNALLYTDHVLAQTVRWLNERAGRFDAGLVYVSDHGESLGERGLFLHGVPFMIAPAEQTQVPMVWWMSPGFARSAGVDAGCLAGQAGQAWSHDNLFHTTLGLLGVQTSVYERALDIAGPCRQ